MGRQNVVHTDNEILCSLRKEGSFERYCNRDEPYDIRLSDTGQHKNTNIAPFHLYEAPRAVRFRKQNGGCQKGRRQRQTEMEFLLKGYKTSVLE
jgi:hypothetical protein